MFMSVNNHETQHLRHHSSSHLTLEIFLTRFKKNIRKDLKNIQDILVFVVTSLYGVLLFLLDFEMVNKVLGIILPPLFIYFTGTYMTLLPYYVVIPLVFIPKQYSLPIIGLSVVLSFFIVFMV